MTSAASLSPNGTTSVLLFDQICRPLTQPSAFNLSLPEQFRTSAFCHLEGDVYTIVHMFDCIHLVKTMGGGHGSRVPLFCGRHTGRRRGLLDRSPCGRQAGCWGLAHRNVTREYSEPICSLEGLLASGGEERVGDDHELEPATTAKSDC
jgi:hypothetical protein